MAQRTVFVPEIGELLLAKRRGARNIRLSITPTGKVRVGIPYWAPYSAGISFAKSKSTWIQAQLAKNEGQIVSSGDLIGKYHRIDFRFAADLKQIAATVKNPRIIVTSSLPLSDPTVQVKVLKACERALKDEAEHLLPQRLETLAKRHDFSYKNVKIRKLTSRWGSCSNDKNILLSYFLIQLPWPLIDYVLLHELTHTEYLHHQKDFWDRFIGALPQAKKLQKDIRRFSPRILPTKGVA